MCQHRLIALQSFRDNNNNNNSNNNNNNADCKLSRVLRKANAARICPHFARNAETQLIQKNFFLLYNAHIIENKVWCKVCLMFFSKTLKTSVNTCGYFRPSKLLIKKPSKMIDLRISRPSKMSQCSML
jgi:hypothetical protein